MCLTYFSFRVPLRLRGNAITTKEPLDLDPVKMGFNESQLCLFTVVKSKERNLLSSLQTYFLICQTKTIIPLSPRQQMRPAK
jgi:hypothetical protein